jgi:hypothetical protein
VRSAAATGPAIQLSPTLPADVSFGNTVTLPALQRDFDIFSWNSFIAAVWPGRGTDRRQPDGLGNL